MLEVFPISLKQANEIVLNLHRHHGRKHVHTFSIGLRDKDTGVIHGAAIISKPCARGYNDKPWVEVSRLVTDGVPNGCSMLYSAAARAAKEMGYERIQSYILESELGTSLKASGWKYHHTTKAFNWHTHPTYRALDAPTCLKQLWIRELGKVSKPVSKVSKIVSLEEQIRLSGKSRATFFRHKKHGKPVRKPKPWETLGVSKATYYRNLKKAA